MLELQAEEGGSMTEIITIYGCAECGWEGGSNPDQSKCPWCGHEVMGYDWPAHEWELACLERQSWAEANERKMEEVDGSWDY